ncbi:DUF6320 domain-containing protein [Salinicoccus siamensis]|uniref:DUF6320 domain-containing protein n=1 Tax=Salinicoccus siamensis TaxID=381830 RepID=A0ABV5Z287_9STAP
MTECPNCGVWVGQVECPLCDAPTGIDKQDGETWYPDYNREEQRIKARITRIAIFLGVLAVIASLAVNIIVMPQFLWVFYVAVAVFYVLVSLSHTILSASHIGGKITAQVVSLTILLLVIDAMSGSVQWSVDYVVPFLIIGGILLMSIFMLRVRLKWSGYVSFLLLMIALSFVPGLLHLVGMATVMWPSVVALLFGVTTFTLIFAFATRAFMTQLGRRFHL